MAADSSGDYVDLIEAARILGVHPQTLRRFIKQKRLPCLVWDGRYLIRRDDLDWKQGLR